MPEFRTPNRIAWQKWQLALTVFAIYWPIRLYVALNNICWAFVQKVWPFWLVEILVTIVFFWLWLTVAEWFQQRVFKLMGKDFPNAFDLPSQLITFLLAGGLAVLFNMGFYWLWLYMGGHQQLGFADDALLQAGHSPLPTMRPDADRIHKFFNGLTIMAMLAAFYLATNRRGYQQLEEVRVKAEKLKQEAAQAQFVALKDQVNPHFLFNSLSILSSLIQVNPQLSVRFVGQLSKSYRYVLDQRNAQSVTLQEELTFLKAYTFLLHIRFGDKFKVVDHIPVEQTTHYRIAPLTLQLLIENAVKHNQMSSEAPLLVTLVIDQDYLVVTNLIRLRPKVETSTGVGLTNITKRYQLITDRPVQIQHQPNVFSVKIPLLT